ncbi:mitochondrial 2-enoyl thioester reductase [Oleoguttula sp. CCFEE 5521]
MAPLRALTRFSHPFTRSRLSHLPQTHLPRTSFRSISVYGYEQAKALTFPDYGEPKDVLRLHSHSISTPHSNLLTLKFLASPINPADINQIQGVYPSKPTFTTTLGSAEPLAVGGNEGVAEVIALGSGVKGLKKGDWVIQRAPGFGTWRTHAQTTEDGLLRIEYTEGLTPVQVGTVSVNPCTAYRMLVDFVKMKPGDWSIQNGANSGVGRAAIQLAKLWGYKSINVVRKREEGMDALRSDLEGLGADVVVTDEEVMERGFGDKIKEITNGGRDEVKLGLNCVGGKLVNAMAKVLSPNAHMVTYGAMSKQPVTLPTPLLIFKNISFDGFWVSKWSDRNPEEKKRCVDEILDLTREGKFKDTPMAPVHWDATTKQDELVNAVQGTLEGYRNGKGIFVFGET